MSRLLAYALYGARWVLWQLRRPLGRLRRAPAWIEFVIEEPMSELPAPRRPRWQRLFGRSRPLSLHELRQHFRRIAAARGTTGIVLHLRPVEMSAALLQSYRELIAELRAAGKRVVCYAPTYSTATYHVACACDEVLLLRGGSLNPFGFARTYMFFADALARFGLQADVVQITPYKTALDFLARSSMSDEAREMATWLADAAYQELVDDIAAGRNIDAAAAQEIVDATPTSDDQAMASRAVDGVLYEEELPARLGGRLTTWGSARRRLPRPAPRKPGRYIALLRIEGTIVDGRSARPPLAPPIRIPIVLQARAGDITVAQQSRRLAADRRVAAVLLWVDSGGGSSTASESMTAALSALAAKKPLVAAMGSVAASGGYHVVTAASRVFAQPGAITGSIGVLSGKVTVGGLLDQARLHREPIIRGENAAMFGTDAPFTQAQRARLTDLVEHTYEQFVGRVAGARKMSVDDVKAVGGGRVWTGRQALERGLVDEIGGVERAIAHARSLAGLSESAPVRDAGGGGDMPPSGTGQSVAYALEGARALNQSATWLLCPLLAEGSS